MLIVDIDNERLRQQLVGWDNLEQDDIKEATAVVQEVIARLEEPPIVYDGSTLRPPTEEERNKLLEINYFYGTYAPDVRSGVAGLMVVCKNGETHSALAFELQRETERGVTAMPYETVVLFAPVLNAAVF